VILKLKDVQNNPFRDLKGNPLIEAKIEELVNSIKISGYWDNCIAVKRGDNYCLAYGHHRLEAAKRAKLTEADFIIKDLDDAMLIKIMDLENRETYASSPASLIEAVKAVVNALAEGSIPAFEIDSKTSEDRRRYAPSYVPYNACSGEDKDITKAYTASNIAQFLGRTMAKGKGEGEGDRPAKAIVAALDFLCLKELGKINNSVLVKDDRPISATKLVEITSEIKQRHVAEVVRRGKTQAELAVEREKQLALQAKIKAQEKAADTERKALLQKIANADRAENEKKAEAERARLKKQQEESRNTEERNRIAMQALEAKVAQIKAWEASQRLEDAYAPIRRDVQTLISRWETKVSENDAEREQVKALAKRKDLRPEDRLRLRKAAVAVADHYSDWVAPQFAPLPTGKAELKAMAKKEKSKRAAEKEKA
jgi:hypothetical protein